MVFKLICPHCAKRSITFYADFIAGRMTARCVGCGHTQEG